MAGAGYKLFTTGQVLTAAEVNTYLQEQTVMVFNDAASRTTALSGVLAEGMVSYLKSTKVVEIYNGTAWASLDDPNAIQNTIVDAKGDLIAATGNDVPARLAVGNNGETLVADSSATTGLRWQEPKAGNPILNSAFQIWQRGTSIATGGSFTYGADRWQTYRGGLASGSTVSRQTTGDTTNLPNIQYCARVQRDSGNTSTAGIVFYQSFESANSIPFAGKTVTLSFYARRGSNYSATSNALAVDLITGTGTDQNYGSAGYTGAATAATGSVTLTTTWQRFSITGTIAATATELAPVFTFTPTGTAGANDFFEITGVQLEVGSVASPFKTYAATLAGELAACQRYCYVINGSTSVPVNFNAAYYTSTRVFAVVPFPVTMRSTPSTTISSQTMVTVYSNGGNRASTAIAESDRSIQTGMLDITTAATTAGHACMISFVTASTSITWSAEL